MSEKINTIIAHELDVRPTQVEAAIRLLDAGDTVPFIARYRKEVTGSLDDIQLRTLADRLTYLRELGERKQAILKSITEQGKLTVELKSSILEAETKTRLEDLYKPYVVKRRTKAQIAREAGLQPLADSLLSNPGLIAEAEAAHYLNTEKAVTTVKEALDGAKQILMQQFADDAEVIGTLREYLWENGVIVSKVVTGQESAGEKFSDYFDYRETLNQMPSHRALALFRGRKEGYLSISIDLDEEKPEPGCLSSMEHRLAHHFSIENKGRAADPWLVEVVKWTWRVKVRTALDMDLKKRLREAAEEHAIDVFGNNLKDLLLAAPAGQKVTMGLDPGLRTGVKVIIVDGTGKFLDSTTIYPHPPQKQWDESIQILAKLVKQYQVALISIGNGTASRETDKLASELIKKYSQTGLTKLVVSEAGASVYSASELASREFPDLDVSLRGAVSIARRLQDPLAELVKIEPKAIGVGQYQHDVSQVQLVKKLESVVEDCVNGVGVDLNTASIPLLTKVSGLTPALAANIIAYRENHGAFKNRRELLNVSRLGEKAFEQAAGFLRIIKGDNPLDASAVHPEAYPLVEKIVTQTNRDIRQLIGDRQFLKNLNPADFTDEHFGLPTVKDIILELDKPGRDPRPEFKAVLFKEGIETPADLREGMILEGVVTNVTNFGAFVDIGVHQDGLVHISQLADKFIKDPRDIVKTGDIVKAKVIDIDIKRHRIALTMRLSEKMDTIDKPQRKHKSDHKKLIQHKQTAPKNNAMAAALAKLKN